MIKPIKRPDEKIIQVTCLEEGLLLETEYGKMKLNPVTPEIIRVIFTRAQDFVQEQKPGVIYAQKFHDWEYRETDYEVILTTEKLKLQIQKETLSICYFSADGKLLLKERLKGSKTLEEYDSYKVMENDDAVVETIVTPDGEKKVIRDAQKIFDRKLYRGRLHLEWQEDEALYGLGQQEEGKLNLRGSTVYLHQANMKIAIPLMVSSMGYGILMDTYGPLIFNDNEYGSYLYTEADMEMDYYFIYGENMDGVIRGYRTLTGKATMLPKWAFGYIQSQERYESQDEILDVVREYRKRGLGLDCIVLDWCSWEDGLWGEKIFDSSRFPDPKEMIQRLHDENVHFMISIWPNMDKKSENYKELHKEGKMLPLSTTYNPLDQRAREIYWNQANRGLFSYGVDAWWCDSSEPFTPEWARLEKPEPANMYHEYVEAAGQQMPLQLANAFTLYHARTLYEGQRSVTNEKRVVNLTRSGYTGIQRYGTILWSGDTSANWETLQKQIVAGLNLCASGMPYWTLDIGAFFVKKGLQWYWNGDYEDGCMSPAYRELYVRWYQYGCFLPVFRAHGTDTRREMWNYGDENSREYNALVKMNHLRYQLIPYIYSSAGRVWRDDWTIMRMLAFDFPQDRTAREIQDQYLFGESLMVCPVTTAMYYTVDGQPMTNKEKTRKVYLPQGADWYDYWTNQFYTGGQEITVPAPLDMIPIFVKAGSILPLGQPLQYTEEQQQAPLQIRIYPGKDAEFELYEDAGDGYDYEQGAYKCTTIHWSQQSKMLTVKKDGKTVEKERFDIVVIES